MGINLSVTSLAVIRWKARLDGAAPANSVEILLDSTYDNEKMEQQFSNMQFTDGGDESDTN